MHWKQAKTIAKHHDDHVVREIVVCQTGNDLLLRQVRPVCTESCCLFSFDEAVVSLSVYVGHVFLCESL